MIVKTTGLKFYETIAERDWTYRNIENHSDNVLILGNPWGIIPFQIITDRLIGLITVCNITNREGIITDLLPVGTYNILDYITIENDTFLYWVIFDGIVDQEIDDGVYDLEIGDGTQTFYSEVFKVSCECELIYRDKYGNNEDAIFDSESEFSSRIANIAKFIDNPVFYPPIGADTIWDRGFTNTPYFCLNRDGSLFYDGDYYMYYGACNNVLQTDANPEDPGYNNDRVGLAKTKDFVNFTRVTGLSGDGDGCVMTWGNGDRGDGVGHYGGNPTLLEGHGYHQGQHTGANNAPQLACANETWVVNQFVGLILVNRTDQCWGTITANGVNSITCADGFAGGTDDDWDTNDFYDIACWDQYDTQLGCIINDGGTFRMWFTGNMNTDYKQYLPPAAYSDHMNLLYATSPDGEVWTKQIAPIITYGAGGDDDDDGVYAPYVIWDEDDLKWKMWYIGKRALKYRVMYATADNPQGPWTKHATTAVYYDVVLGGGTWGANVRKLADGTYLMIYSGVDQPNDGLRYATSPDGIVWTGQGVFLPLGVIGKWDEDTHFWPSYFVENGIFYLFYRGDNKVTTPGEGEHAGSSEIGFASIPINWKRCDRLTLTWWNENDFCDVIYQTGYKNRLFFDAIMSKPENVIFEESQEDEEHNIFPTIQTQRKYYSFETGGSEAMFDMLGTLRLHDYIEITFKNGERQRIFDVKLETTWQDENLCMFKISFFVENCTTAGCEDNFVLQENLILNGDFSAWVGDDPADWIVTGEVGADPEISEVAPNEGHGGAGTGACNIFTTGAFISIRQTILTIGKTYIFRMDVTTAVGGTIVLDGMAIPPSYNTIGSKVFIFVATGTQLIIKRSVACDITIDNVSVIQLD